MAAERCHGVARSCSKGSLSCGHSSRTACGAHTGHAAGPGGRLARPPSLGSPGTVPQAGLAVACGHCDPCAVTGTPEPAVVTVRPGPYEPGHHRNYAPAPKANASSKLKMRTERYHLLLARYYDAETS